MKLTASGHKYHGPLVSDPVTFWRLYALDRSMTADQIYDAHPTLWHPGFDVSIRITPHHALVKATRIIDR